MGTTLSRAFGSGSNADLQSGLVHSNPNKSGPVHSNPQNAPIQLFRARTSTTFADQFPRLCAITQTYAFPNVQILIQNDDLMQEYGISSLEGLFKSAHTGVATAYGGHQFGHFAKLGDGRAALLAEIICESSGPDSNTKHIDIASKGSGLTPYSRIGTDGLATLSSVIREYLVSEAMHGLGIPTTRALAAYSTNKPVSRNGPKPGGILVRTAESFLRFGTFELVAREHPELLDDLIQYAADRHQIEFKEDYMYDSFMLTITARYARLVVEWMSVGFIHGVMNTDNASICGLTIDYGPCAFMEEYVGSKVFSRIDKSGRYAFDKQPAMAKWNIGKLAEALLKTPDVKLHFEPEHYVHHYMDYFDKCFESYYEIMREKFGVRRCAARKVKDLVSRFIASWRRTGSILPTPFAHLPTTKPLLELPIWTSCLKIGKSCGSLFGTRTMKKDKKLCNHRARSMYRGTIWCNKRLIRS